MAWSSAESESRTLPSPACASTLRALRRSASMPSCSAIHSMRFTTSAKSTERKLNCWQREAMVAGNLVRFGGAEDEDHPLGRLFQRLQQRVEGFAGDLVRFVDDEDFIAVARRPVAHVLAQLAHFVDAAIGRRVDFDHVDANCPAAISRQLAHTPQGVAVGPWMQFRQRARMRATVVLPVPRWPEKM